MVRTIMDSRPDPVMSVFSTPEVREMILKKLDSRSLVKCRLVCQSWNTTASGILRKKPVWIKQCWGSEVFLRLCKCMEDSIDFPFTGLNLLLSCWHNGMDSREMAKLFSKLGKHVTHVRLSMTYKYHSNMVDRLLKNAPKVRFLDIGDSLDCYKYTGARLSLPALQALKVQDWSGTTSLLKEIIRAAPNLEKIEQVDCFTWIQMKGLVNNLSSLVSSMTLTCSRSYKSVYSELAAKSPQLTALSVIHNSYSHRFGAALKITLMESRDTLKKIKFEGFHRQLDELPVFPNVEELDFGVTRKSFEENADVSAVLPNLSNECFPKLKKVRLDLGDRQTTRKFIKKYFWGQCEAPLESVDELELESYCGREVLKYLAKTFPRVTYVRLNYQKGEYDSDLFSSRKPADVWYLEAFPCLRKLDIRGFPIRPGSMDSFLTGIPSEIYSKLRTAPKRILSSCCSEILRPNGSILALKNLRQFAVIITGTESEIRKLCNEDNPFMSIVSIWYALELLPDLHTTFLYCNRKHRLIHDDIKVLEEALGPVKEHLTISQCNCPDVEREFFSKLRETL